MSSSTSNGAAALAARLPAPASASASALVTTTTAQIGAITACPDYANQPSLQAAVKALQADNATLEAALEALEKARASLPGLEAAATKAAAVVRRDRHNVAGTLTTVCNGVVTAIEAYGAITSDTHGALLISTAAPAGLALMASKVPGTVKAKCEVVSGGATYFWSVTTDPTLAPTTSAVTTGSRVSLPGQVVGHVVYLRVAVVRRRGGQSVWSDALQITVR